MCPFAREVALRIEKRQICNHVKNVHKFAYPAHKNLHALFVLQISFEFNNIHIYLFYYSLVFFFLLVLMV